MKHTKNIYKIIGEFEYTFDMGDFCKIKPSKKLNKSETLELFSYIYNNIDATIPIQVLNTFKNINYFEWVKNKLSTTKKSHPK